MEAGRCITTTGELMRGWACLGPVVGNSDIVTWSAAIVTGTSSTHRAQRTFQCETSINRPVQCPRNATDRSLMSHSYWECRGGWQFIKWWWSLLGLDLLQISLSPGHDNTLYQLGKIALHSSLHQLSSHPEQGEVGSNMYLQKSTTTKIDQVFVVNSIRLPNRNWPHDAWEWREALIQN